jgi:hypothetical protein
MNNLFRAYIKALVLEYSQDCAKYLAAVIQMEMTPMTQNDDFLQTVMEKWVIKYKDQRTGRIPTAVPKQTMNLGASSGPCSFYPPSK